MARMPPALPSDADSDDAIVINQVLADISKAVRAAGSSKGVKVIEAYVPEDAHKDNVNRIASKKVDELSPACVVLGVRLTDLEGKKRTKEELADKIVLRIESLFPIHCDDCGDKYRVTLGSSPPASCFLCGQGAHSCRLTIKGSRKGDVWMCSCCYRKHESNTDRKERVIASKEEDADPVEETVEEENQEEVGGETVEQPAPSVNKSLEINPGNVCTFYLNHKCRHGKKGVNLVQGKACPKLHPALCRKYCSYGGSKRLGCTKGSGCKYFHPPLCKGSDARRECFDKQCTLTHLSHTRRKRDGNSNSADNKSQERTRKPYSQAVGGSDTSFAPKRPKQGLEAPKEVAQKANNAGSVTTDFLLRALEELKAEIHLSVGRQLIEFRSALDQQAGMRNQPSIWGTAGTRPLYQSFCS